jgi:hypothetical protein
MKMPKVLLLVLLCALLTGCPAKGKLSTLPKLTDSANSCDVFIIRESSMFGAGISYTAAMDHHDFVAMTSGDYTNIKVASGPHVITVKYPRQMFLGTAENSLEFDCKPGNKVYIYMSPGITVNLAILPDEKGAELVQKSNYIDVK